MRRIALGLLLLMFSKGYAQLVEPISFKEKIHDFGEIVEAAGPAEHEFTFTNTSTRPIKILSVQASCGCTTPGWSKDLIPPGQSGYIKASFDPKGRPGYFNKTLSVTTDFDRNPIVLQIKGSVVDQLSGGALLSASNGHLRFRNNSFNLGKIYVNKVGEPKEFAVQNAGTEEIRFTKVEAPEYLKVTTPESLKAGETGTFRIAYNSKARIQYGFLSDRIEVVTTDKENPVKSFSVYATAEEFFPTLSADELAKAPALVVDKYAADFARVKQGSNVNQESILTNRGKQNLELRFVQSNCTCLTAVTDKNTLKPGESTKLRWTLSTAGRIGTQNKAITLYSNDPRNPVQRITISGFIESQ
ncbi:MAG: DUF1573 domain-containing protein [Cyclobacteriaceae bacterium]|nr:DUF1573 domain-containing protein [Cyclobacteriaceae bacterium]